MDDHSHSASQKTLYWAFFLITSFIIVEVIGGIITGSLALLTDAFHMLTDSMSIGLAIIAAHLARTPHDSRHTFGRHRFEVITALGNGVFLILIVGWTVLEAYNRFLKPQPIDFEGMFVIGLIGLIINIIAAAILFRGQEENLNVKGAFLHVLGDTLGSVGVLAAAILIFITTQYVWDLIVSLFIATLIAISAFGIIRESIHILAEGTPKGIDAELIKAELEQKFPMIEDVHDLHVWMISSNLLAAALHIVLSNNKKENVSIKEIQEFLKKKFNINHTTIQIENKGMNLSCYEVEDCYCEH